MQAVPIKTEGQQAALGLLVAQIADIEAKVGVLEAEILAWHKADAISQRLASIPGIGPITASTGPGHRLSRNKRRSNGEGEW